MKPPGDQLIEVREYGESGPTVVLLHGGPGAPGSVASLARDLSSDFRVLEPLQRCSGNEVLTVERHCLDLAAVAPEKTLLVGWSWGAMLALSFFDMNPAGNPLVKVARMREDQFTERWLWDDLFNEWNGTDFAIAPGSWL